jgi:hypothetical protein
VQGVIKKINGTFLIYNVTINYKENKEHPRNISNICSQLLDTPRWVDSNILEDSR